ncbi:MAG: tetratricopeptide repeat protein, partial [Candidatus Desulfofervidus auxilii]|nr:tetratricopeptide repeat protein [Candidatus Desulfofervidus auxilii]
MRWFIYPWIFICIISCASTGLNKKREAEVHFRLGDSYLRQGKPGFALRELVQAQKLDPQNPDIHLALGLAYMARGDLDKAEA